MSILCTPIPSTSSAPPSVHTLAPADVSALHALGIPATHRDEASRVVSRVAELLSMFNPEVMAKPVEDASSLPRTLLEEAESLVRSISHQVTEWKVVLLFVPADSLCACSPDVAEKVKTAVREVEEALQLLQEQLPQSLVHAAVWGTIHQEDSQCNCKDDQVSDRLHRATILKSLQDSLSQALQNPKPHSKEEEFAAVLQSAPLVLEQATGSSTWFDLDRLAMQLWENMLQTSTGQSQFEDGPVLNIPCPTQERPYLRTMKNTPMRKEIETSATVDPFMGTEMSCPHRSPSPTIPTSVHELRPGDFKVVAAVGDSITAANGVGANKDNILLVINEYRGLSWSIGGDENLTSVTTLPNILKEFNPNVTGFSEGICKATSRSSFLNQAVAGAKSADMVAQVNTLVNLMKTDTRIDFQNDWKVITMFIGGNDICDFCTDTTFFSPSNIAIRIQQALDILHKEVPRAVVNLVELLNVVPLRDLHKDPSLGCPTWFVNYVCPCVLRPKDGTTDLQKVADFNQAYQLVMRQLIDSGRYDTHDNFTVILQPFMREVHLPMLENGHPDRSFFTPDCFHLSQKAHTLMARALWNNMLEPVGNKTFTQDFEAGIELKCPSETHPFIRTAVNSNYTFPGPPPTTAPSSNWGSDFTCTNMAPSDSVPTSAHKVRPGDIKVVGALGDSITAGFGAKAKNLLELLIESRGVSWSIGGDQNLESVTTLPNILRKFNPEIKGMSMGQGRNQSGFNMAVSGAKIEEIPDQIRTLIDAMKSDTTLDFDKDWKLVTLFIGGNDLCQYCNDRDSLSPQKYGHHMMTSLDLLYNEVPRVIVNILKIMEIEGLRQIKRDNVVCNLLQSYLCSCFLLPKDNSLELSEMKRINRDMQVETENVVHSGRYDGREDFAAVVQPFFQNTVIPLSAESKPDDTFFSEDCFHFSERGHASLAVALWNSMLEPVGGKQTYNNFTDARHIKCPTEEHPYIFTNVNSFPIREGGPHVEETVPVWLAAVLAVAGLVVGCFVTGLLCYCTTKRNKKRNSHSRKTTF